MKKRVVICINDPGHGWAKVKRDFVEKLGVLDLISGFSYQRGDDLYLEEDMDMAIYVTALRLNGMVPDYRSTHSNKSSKVRSYAQWDGVGAKNPESFKTGMAYVHDNREVELGSDSAG